MAAHNGEKHSRQSLRDSPEFRELAELMAGVDPERQGDAFTMAERQDDCSNGKEETTAYDTPGRTQAGPDELGKVVVSTDDRDRSEPRGDSAFPERGA